MFAIGCGPAWEAPLEADALESSAEAVVRDNGLNLNGLNLNGLNLNGLNLNGLNLNGFSTKNFYDWFQVDPASRATVMKYIVECAVPAGETRTYTPTGSTTTYQWTGVLGLAPSWSSGQAASTVELQVVSACLAAHANKYNLHVNISLRGLTAANAPISTTSQENSSYTLREGCFFGNLFDGTTGVFSANDGLTLTAQQSSPRVCGLAGTQCAPMVHVGSCASRFTLDATGTYYTSCTYNNVTYRPITTRMLPADIATCGNGVCERTETCKANTESLRCTADCGTCS
ncbi:MAG: hypothetical protein ABW123_17015 [Cystobacter sp.]